MTRQREGLGVGARAGDHRERTVPPRVQFTNVGGVEQLLVPQQHAVGDLEHRVDAARIELRLPVGLRRREQLPCRCLHRAHPLRVVRRRLAGGVVVVSRRE